jgi:single-strand DNA-binding protein
MSVNKAILIGNLGRDPEVRFTGSGKAVCKFPIATSEVWYDQQEQKQERTVWHNIVVWGKQGETCGKYLSKGRQVYIEGRIENRSYDDREGNKRYISEIIAQQVRFLGGQGQGAGRSTGDAPPMPDEPPAPGEAVTDDDIPF